MQCKRGQEQREAGRACRQQAVVHGQLRQEEALRCKVRSAGRVSVRGKPPEAEGRASRKLLSQQRGLAAVVLPPGGRHGSQQMHENYEEQTNHRARPGAGKAAG